MREDAINREPGFRNANSLDTNIVLWKILVSNIVNIVMRNIPSLREKVSLFYQEGAAGSSKMLVPMYQTTRQRIPEDLSSPYS